MFIRCLTNCKFIYVYALFLVMHALLLLFMYCTMGPWPSVHRINTLLLLVSPNLQNAISSLIMVRLL